MLWILTSLLCCTISLWQRAQREDPGGEMCCAPGAEPPLDIVVCKWPRDCFHCFYSFPWGVGQEHHLASKLMRLLPRPGLRHYCYVHSSVNKHHSAGRPPSKWAFMQVLEKWEAKLACCKVWDIFCRGVSPPRMNPAGKKKAAAMCLSVMLATG